MNNMNILHCAGSVVVYQVKLKPACPATGTSYKSEISGLASLAIEFSKEINECPDQTGPLRGCFAHLFFASNTIVFSSMWAHILTYYPDLSVCGIIIYKLKNA